MNNSLSCLTLASILVFSSAHFIYRQSIPNGDSVPNPCTLANDVWNGVGHISPGGGGPRNLFGLDFHSAGHKWTQDLCHLDSDNDGKTNGEELGDPHCSWHEGEVAQNPATGHPGVCEPVSSSACMKVNGRQHGVSQNGSCNAPS